MSFLPGERCRRRSSHGAVNLVGSCRALRQSRRRRRQRAAGDHGCAWEACGRHAGRSRLSPSWDPAAVWNHRAEFDGEESGMPDPLRPAIGTLEPPPRLDALLPPEMAKRAEDIGVKKASITSGISSPPSPRRSSSTSVACTASGAGSSAPRPWALRTGSSSSTLGRRSPWASYATPCGCSIAWDVEMREPE